jgi:hypothetical protein
MRQRQMFKLSSAVYPLRAVFLLQDLDTQRVSRLNDLVTVPPIQPCVAHFGTGKVDNAAKHVVESGPAGHRIQVGLHGSCSY